MAASALIYTVLGGSLFKRILLAIPTIHARIIANLIVKFNYFIRQSAWPADPVSFSATFCNPVETAWLLKPQHC